MMKVRAAALLLLTLGAFGASAQTKFVYPPTRKVEQKDSFAGVEVIDPYRWLETDVRESREVSEWIEAQNKVTFGYLQTLPYRESIKQRLTEIWNYEKYSIPTKRGGRYYFQKNSGLQNQSVLYVQKSLESTARTLLDPNSWSKDGTIALAGYSFSDDGRHMAYGVSEAGSDWTTWKVMEIESGKLLSDELKWVKFSGTDWTRDSKGFFYSRFPEPSTNSTFQSLNKNQKLYYHRVGTPQSEDVLVYHRPEQPEWSYSASVTEDGRYLIISVWKGTDARNQILYKDLTEPYGMPIALIDNFDNEYSFVGNDGPRFYFKTDLDAPRARLIAINVRQPDRSKWEGIIAQSENSLTDVDYVGGHFVTEYLEDAKSEVKVFTTEGKLVRKLELGTIGTASGFSGKPNDPETFYSFASFTVPPSIYRYDVVTGEKKLVSRANVKFDPNQYEVKQVFYKSKDGTRVPMFISHKKGVRLDGNNPTLLYAYGGFNASMTPGFSISRLVWMEMGGVYALPNLRGGGEYGEEWHKAGTKLKKQNVFDDFIAAAEWLVANKYTRPEKLGIWGGSNGGLLVGAVMTQRPELFGAALPAVGVMDMLRFHKFTAGRYWVDDYGSADDPTEFKALYAYSPYHNLRKGKHYPATLVTTADHDDRVVPGHSFKFAAALQEAQAGTDPVLIRIETRAGHGAGKPITKTIEEIADQWAFLVANLGLQMPKGK
ncbi:MAG TPA: prolyl oligopeptidase family serine peptidase [Thermoanaerobaculia bacterium]|nr:prolyl oligopeptidase family serine peptidase [Thermoanaerobaculia bacterium]